MITLNTLDILLQDNGQQFEEAKEVFERCLAGQMKVLGEDHKDTLSTLHNLGLVYVQLENYEKSLEYYKRARKGKERLLGKNHPSTLDNMVNTAIIYAEGQWES